MNCGYGCWLDRNSPMTLFMTSCGGKKSSRNCGRILDTTRASLGNPFRILQTGKGKKEMMGNKKKKIKSVWTKVIHDFTTDTRTVVPSEGYGESTCTCRRAQTPSPWRRWRTRCQGPAGQSWRGGWRGWPSPCLRRMNRHDPPWRPPPLLQQSPSQPDL